MAERELPERMPMPPGIWPPPPKIEPKTGIPMPQPSSAPSGLTSGIATPTLADRLAPPTIDEMRRRAGGK